MKNSLTIKDMVGFGNYILSKDRIKHLMNNEAFPNQQQLIERLSVVHDADVANYLHSIKKTN